MTLAELAPMFEEMKRAPAIVRPSAFWEVWNERNLQLLAERGFGDFKRTMSYTQKLWTAMKKKAAYLPGC